MLFKKKSKPENIKEILQEFNNLKGKIEKISQDLEILKKDSKLHIQKIGLIRYNPFSNVGGDQSFSLALLDSNNSGIVITSLYAEGGNRIYGKKIENGKSEYTLSQEEQEAINKAIK